MKKGKLNIGNKKTAFKRAVFYKELLSILIIVNN